jgi:hypothetical protein
MELFKSEFFGQALGFARDGSIPNIFLIKRGEVD